MHQDLEGGDRLEPLEIDGAQAPDQEGPHRTGDAESGLPFASGVIFFATSPRPRYAGVERGPPAGFPSPRISPSSGPGPWPKWPGYTTRRTIRSGFSSRTLPTDFGCIPARGGSMTRTSNRSLPPGNQIQDVPAQEIGIADPVEAAVFPGILHGGRDDLHSQDGAGGIRQGDGDGAGSAVKIQNNFPAGEPGEVLDHPEKLPGGLGVDLKKRVGRNPELIRTQPVQDLGRAGKGNLSFSHGDGGLPRGDVVHQARESGRVPWPGVGPPVPPWRDLPRP